MEHLPRVIGNNGERYYWCEIHPHKFLQHSRAERPDSYFNWSYCKESDEFTQQLSIRQIHALTQRRSILP